MVRVRRETRPVLEQRREAANTIACMWRKRFVWRKEREAAVTKIQAAWRGVTGRRDALERKVTRERLAATKLQASYRGLQARKEARSRRMELASVKLQAYWRGVRGRRRASSIRSASVLCPGVSVLAGVVPSTVLKVKTAEGNSRTGGRSQVSQVPSDFFYLLGDRFRVSLWECRPHSSPTAQHTPTNARVMESATWTIARIK